MAGRVDWFGNQFIRQYQAETKRRTRTAAIRLQSWIKSEIKQSGRLVYHPIGKKGKALKKTLTIRNFTHSRPGNPPFTQTGHLHDMIMWELVPVGMGGPSVIGRVGTNVKYGRWLELGTRKMKRRPFIVVTLRRHEPEIRSILLGQSTPGSLIGITSNQFRSGILGRGATRAGY